VKFTAYIITAMKVTWYDFAKAIFELATSSACEAIEDH
jgi:dTDP-4-dehydrorhamnose reductase